MSKPYVKDAKQGEQPSRRLDVDIRFSRKPLAQHFPAFGVEPPAAHVHGLYLARAGGYDRLVVAVADDEIILDDFFEIPEAQAETDETHIFCIADIKQQLAFAKA
jgi:hypothetical protein